MKDQVEQTDTQNEDKWKKIKGWDLPKFKLYDLTISQRKTLLVEKNVMVKLGKSHPYFLN